MSKLIAKKRFGQHFLKDQEIVCQIIQAANLTSNDTVVEIGPGPGILTKALLETPIQKLYSVEIDSQFYPHLKSLEAFYPDRFHLMMKDALTVSLKEFPQSRLKIIANLPYNIGTALILNWLKEIEKVDSMVLMLQKEVVDRICAVPQTKAYGGLSILCQVKCYTTLLFDVPPGAFVPPPKVMSAVVRLVPKEQFISAEELSYLEKIMGILFQQRRKMLRVSLRKLDVDNIEGLLKQHGFDPHQRPESLSVEQMILLAKVLYGAHPL